MKSPQPVLDLDPWYAGHVRHMARVCGAVIAGLGIFVIANSLRYPNSKGPLVQAEAIPGLVLGAVLITLGVGSWWMASGGPWLLFDRLMVHPFNRSDRDYSQPFNIILWWETRRLPYNLIVGTAGLVSGVLSFTAAAISESKGGEPVGMPDGIFIIAAPILFGIAANICYTAGWIVELFVRGFLHPAPRRFATLAFASGLAFSVAVTFLPAVFAVAYLLGLLTGVVHPSHAAAR